MRRHTLGWTFQRVSNYFNQIVASVQTTEGYKYGDKVVLAGEFYYINNESPVETTLFESDDGYRELNGVALENGLITSGVRSYFLKTYLGFDPGEVPEDVESNIKHNPEYLNMPIYPAEGSIKKIDDIWVVKMCNELWYIWGLDA